MMRFELGLEKPDQSALHQRFHHRVCVYCRRLDPAGALHLCCLLQTHGCGNGVVILGRVDPSGSFGIWLYQRTLHRHASSAQRFANRFDWQPGRRRGVSDRAGDFVRTEWSTDYTDFAD